MSRTAIALLAVLAVAVVAAVLVFAAYDRELTRARSDVRRGGALVTTSAGAMEYAERGIGVPVLSIHGAGGGYDQGLANITDFLGDDFRVIAPSRFGYLGTPVPADASDAAQADAHAALLAALGVQKAIVVGVSAGARSAVELAVRHPDAVAALILIVPGTHAPTSPVMVEGTRASAFVLWLVNTGADFMWWAMEKIAPSVLVRFVGVEPRVFAAASPAERERVMQIVRHIQPLSLRFAGINIDSSYANARPRYEDIAAPTLVISARDDLFNTLPAAAYAVGAIPGARLAVYDTGGHLLVGRQREVRAAVGEFIARHARTTN